MSIVNRFIRPMSYIYLIIGWIVCLANFFKGAIIWLHIFKVFNSNLSTKNSSHFKHSCFLPTSSCVKWLTCMFINTLEISNVMPLTWGYRLVMHRKFPENLQFIGSDKSLEDLKHTVVHYLSNFPHELHFRCAVSKCFSAIKFK